MGAADTGEVPMNEAAASSATANRPGNQVSGRRMSDTWLGIERRGQ